MATICSRGEGALDKADVVYQPINHVSGRAGKVMWEEFPSVLPPQLTKLLLLEQTFALKT